MRPDCEGYQRLSAVKRHMQCYLITGTGTPLLVEVVDVLPDTRFARVRRVGHGGRAAVIPALTTDLYARTAP